MKLIHLIKKNILLITATVVLMLTLFFSAYYGSYLLNSGNIIAQAEPDLECDLQQAACSISLPDGETITLSITPRPIPLLEKINIDVKLGAIDARAVTVDFNGTTMNMGLNRFDLKKSEPNHFQGTGALPVCIRNSMEWKAHVIVKTDKGKYIAPFIFITRKQY